jgi:hypothetical protein
MSTPVQTAHSPLTYAAQYRSDGVVKKFKHPYRLEVLREKESWAVAVSFIFSSGTLFPEIFLQISLSASKDNQKARETHLGGALRRVGVIQLIFLVDDIGDAINLTGLC